MHEVPVCQSCRAGLEGTLGAGVGPEDRGGDSCPALLPAVLPWLTAGTTRGGTCPRAVGCIRQPGHPEAHTTTLCSTHLSISSPRGVEQPAGCLGPSGKLRNSCVHKIWLVDTSTHSPSSLAPNPLYPVSTPHALCSNQHRAQGQSNPTNQEQQQGAAGKEKALPGTREPQRQQRPLLPQQHW